MANLDVIAEWIAGIYQLETTDPVLGGPDGIDNLQAKQLAARTLWLKNLLEDNANGLAPHIAQNATEDVVGHILLATIAEALAGINTGKAVTAAGLKAVVDQIKAALQTQTYTAFLTASAAPSYTLTPAPAIAGYAAGQRFRIKFHAAGTTGSNTLNVNSNGAKALRQYDGSGVKTPAIVAVNMLTDVEYDGVDFVILNPLLSGVAYLESPPLSGIPTAPTAAPGTNTTQLSTTAFVQAAIAALVQSSPAALDTLHELASALGDDPNFATTMTNALAAKAALAGNSFTGVQIFGKAAQGTKIVVAASNIDVSLANYFTKTLTGVTTFTVSNAPASGTVSAFTLELTNGGDYVINWWSGMKWSGGIPPTLTQGGTDVLGFYTLDGGTTWRGCVVTKDIR